MLTPEGLREIIDRQGWPSGKQSCFLGLGFRGLGLELIITMIVSNIIVIIGCYDYAWYW